MSLRDHARCAKSVCAPPMSEETGGSGCPLADFVLIMHDPEGKAQLHRGISDYFAFQKEETSYETDQFSR